MVSPTLAVTAIVHGATASAFLYVGSTLARRAVPATDKAARVAYGVWWIALGAFLMIQAGLHLVAGLGEPPVALFLAARAVTPALLAASVWGITFHILYLYTGRAWLGRPLAVFFGIVGLALYYASFVPIPQAVRVEPWLAELERTGEGPLYRSIYVIFGLPPLLASLGYLFAMRRADKPEERYRIALVGGSILLWVGAGLVARLAAGDLWKFVSLPVFGLGAAGVAVLAYRPPRAWRDRWSAAPPAASSQDAFARRIRELV